MSKCRDKVIVRTTATGRSIICTHARTGPEDLIREFATLPSLSQLAAEIDYP